MSYLKDLTALTALSTDDIIHVVDAPATTAVDKKITVANLILNLTTLFDVRAYGAVGNGSTDDTAAIQAAITAASASGGVVFFPPGTYPISAALTITSSNVTLQGSGAGATTIRVASGSEGIIALDIGNGSDTIAHIRIANLLLTSASQKTSNPGIRVRKGFKIWLENLRIEKQYRAVYLFNSTQVYFTNSDIRDTKENGLVIESDAASGYEWYITNLVMDNPNVSNIGIGLAWYGGESLIVSGLDCLRFNVGMEVNPGASRECRFGFLANALFDTSGDNGVHITNTSTGNTIGLTFTNCWIGTATNYGLLMERPGGGTVQGVRWVGGKVFHNGLAGFRMAGGEDLHISDCDIIGNSQTVSGNRHGVEIGGAFTKFSVIGCRIGGGFGQGNTQGYAISIDAGAADYYTIALNNTAIGNNNSPTINDNGTGVHKVVANNITS